MRIALSGSAGTGKTTLGHALAESLDLPFVEEGMRERIGAGLAPATLTAEAYEDLIESLSEQGVRRVLLCNGHLEPAHVKVLRGIALDYAEDRDGKARVVFPDNTRRRWAGTLGDEFASGDCQAGRYESSIVLAADPDKVRENERRALPEVRVDLVEKMQGGARSFLEAGADQAYCGAPAEATAEEGLDLIDRLATMVVETARETWPEAF